MALAPRKPQAGQRDPGSSRAPIAPPLRAPLRPRWSQHTQRPPLCKGKVPIFHSFIIIFRNPPLFQAQIHQVSVLELPAENQKASPSGEARAPRSLLSLPGTGALSTACVRNPAGSATGAAHFPCSLNGSKHSSIFHWFCSLKENWGRRGNLQMQTHWRCHPCEPEKVILSCVASGPTASCGSPCCPLGV